MHSNARQGLAWHAGNHNRLKQKRITDQASPEGTEPQHSKDRGRRGSTGPPQPEQRRQKHHHDPLVGVQDEQLTGLVRAMVNKTAAQGGGGLIENDDNAASGSNSWLQFPADCTGLLGCPGCHILAQRRGGNSAHDHLIARIRLMLA